MAKKPIYVDAGVAHLLSSCSLLKSKTLGVATEVPPGVVKCFCFNMPTLQRATDASLHAGVEKFHKDFENGELDYLAVFETLKLLQEGLVSKHSASIKLFEDLLTKIENDKREPFKNYYLAQALLFGSYRWESSWSNRWGSSLGTRNNPPFIPYGSSEMQDAFKRSTEQEYPSLGDWPYPGFESCAYPANKELNAPLAALVDAFDKRVFGNTSEGHRRKGMEMSSIFNLLNGLKPGGDFEKAKEVFRAGFNSFPWDPHFHADRKSVV